MLDQRDFPGAVPALQRFSPLDGCSDRAVFLVPDQLLAAVFRREPRRQRLAMLKDAAFQIGGDADVERAMLVVGNDVDISRHAGRMLGIGSSGHPRA